MTIVESPAPTEPVATKPKRWRGVTSWVLIVLACLLAIVSVVVVFARNQLLNTDTYVATVAPLASNPAIQTQVAKQVSSNLIARTDVEARIRNQLPSRAAGLAAPIASGLESVTYQLTLKAVESPQFKKIWVGANRASHEQLVKLLTGTGNGTVSTKNGRITLNLGQVEVTLKKELDAKGITVFDKVPAVKGVNFVLFQSKSLAKTQQLVRLLNKVAVVLPIVTILLFAAGIVLARNHRRGLVRAAFGLAISMALILVILSVATNQYLGSLSPSQSVAANKAVIDIVTNSLRETIRIILIVSAIIAVGALIAGNARLGAWSAEMRRPRWMTEGPTHAFLARYRRGLQWGVLGLALLILVIWSSPTTLVAVVLVVIALVIDVLLQFLAGGKPTSQAVEPGTQD
jgi:hypothetical protein